MFIYAPSPAPPICSTTNLKKNNQKQKAMKNMGVTIYSGWVIVFIPCSLQATAHKVSSMAALPFHVIHFMWVLHPSVQWKRVLDYPALSEWTSDNDYILTQEFLQPQQRAETVWVSYVIFSVSPERFFEDHENVVEVLSDWTRDTENKILFLEKSQKYALFKNPQVS